ncbi:NAD(+) synthetase [Aerococcus urinaehominis]|uniref:NH(3)-dependent NAD(+) synthetase n=1 Tax=Aerococcus urinaehominis TaxID=128944 RepID=A0A109RGS4_9LACT|nr:ammonia-dependent NAD(+) synthetase [Aerococcus urinaehominis]AMB99413.1 NAD(+) synthetase [Aerococcus urinaehominis]SDM24422.1 NAD+ synthase [Aerococcus urinaehominis]
MSKQAEIIEALKVAPTINPGQEVRRSIDFLKAYIKSVPGIKSLVLGISGGQDSTLAGKLSQMAISELRQETGDASYQFIAVRLPYGQQVDAQDARDAVAFIQADQDFEVNIKPAVDSQVASLEAAGLSVSDFNKGNIKARQRMVSQFAIAGECHGLVVGSDHAAEAVTGFYTKFGDGAADIMPLWRLNKRQGKEMLIYLNCPAHLYEKIPIADLEEEKPQQADEDALGVSYQAIDDYLEGQEVADKDRDRIEHLYRISEHKRQLPVNIYMDWWQY